MVKYAHFDVLNTFIDNIHLNEAYFYNFHATQNCNVDHLPNNGFKLL